MPFRSLVLAVMVLLAAMSPAAAKRVALVVGINVYDNFKPGEQLRKAVNDARAVSGRLRELGFEVIAVEDASRNAFFRSWQRFLNNTKPGDEVALYFAGHGIEMNGTNYLLPRDVPAAEDGEEVLRNSAISVPGLMDRLREQKPQVSLIILDACRNNPYEVRGRTRGIGGVRGLTREEPPKGTLMMMSAGTGQAALDALSDSDPHPNSVYTRVLLPLMVEPGLEVTALAKRVRGEVEALAASIGHEQRPAIYDELSGNYFLVTKPVVSAAVRPAPGGAPDAATAWSAIKDTSSPAILEAFIAEFGGTLYGNFARARLNEIRTASAVPAAPPAPPGPGASSAATLPPQAAAPASAPPKAFRPTAAEAAKAWTSLRESADVSALEQFADQAAGTFYADLARSRAEELKRRQPRVAVVAPPAVPPAPSAVTPAVGFTPPEVTALDAARERALKPKDTFKDCSACPDMVVAPAGEFLMGSTDKEDGRAAVEGPRHRVGIARPFAVGRIAVTFDEWEACVTAGGCNGYSPADIGRRRGRHPVVNVSWDDAQAYVAWLSRTTGKTYRLLTEAEREYVARAGTMTPFWFGAAISSRQANYDGRTAYAGGETSTYRERVLPADALSANPFGLHNVHGNVHEWVEDCFVPTYRGAPADGTARKADECRLRVIRGGSFLDDPQQLRSAARAGYGPGERVSHIGFRVARGL